MTGSADTDGHPADLFDRPPARGEAFDRVVERSIPADSVAPGRGREVLTLWHKARPTL